MKKSQIYSMTLLMWLLFLSLATFTPAATPSYVGIENNDTYTGIQLMMMTHLKI